MRRAGSIRQRSAGSYEVRYWLPADGGKRKLASVTVRGTAKDAERELRRRLREVDTGQHADPNKISFRTWQNRWLAMIEPELATATVQLYSYVSRCYLLPAFGDMQLAKVQPVHIQQLYSELAVGGRHDGRKGPPSAETRRAIHRCLSASLRRAVELQILTRNVASVLSKRLPKVERGKIRVLSPAETALVLREARGGYLYAPIMLALSTGARRGEIAALRWKHLDLDRALVEIVEAQKEAIYGRVETGPPKTAYGRRKITLPAFAVEELRDWKRQQAEQLLALGARQGQDTLLCTRPDAVALSPNTITSRFYDFARRLGIPELHFHSLRHTHATALMVAGANPRVAQERLGHHSVAFTLNVYSHVTEGMRDDAAAKIDAVLRGR